MRAQGEAAVGVGSRKVEVMAAGEEGAAALRDRHARSGTLH